MQIRLIQQGAWDMPVDSMPLAVGYLKATLDTSPTLGGNVVSTISNFRGGQTLQEMAKELFAGTTPDILAFSVLGWNYRNFGVLAETFKQVNPKGIVVFGGNHVANQAERVFRELPWVDVVVNGEGEHTFHDLVLHLLESQDFVDEFNPQDVNGISFKGPNGEIVTTADRERIADLDVIPSPFLTGAIPLTDNSGNFRYDVALMETNRGCPYKCSFCYWGGAIGQKMRSFSSDRLAEELDLFGFHKAPSLVLCDSNFGLLEADEEFVELLAKTRERYSYPQALITSWAKNKSQRFYRLVGNLKQHGFHSLFTLALQTLDDEALNDMLRKNMKVNQWESLADWLTEEGLECYGELIWGAPGETPESFLRGYDRLAKKVSRIAVYPMLLLPNTSYMEQRDVHGFITIRGESDDFEYILANRTSTLGENLEMQRFVYWARVLGEQQYFRHIWRPLLDVAKVTQSQAIMSLKKFFEESLNPAAVEFCRNIPIMAESPSISHALRKLHSEPNLQGLIREWWNLDMVPLFPQEWRDFATCLYEYEYWSRQVYVLPEKEPPCGWNVTNLPNGDEWYESDPISFEYNMPDALEGWESTIENGPVRDAAKLVFSARPGYYHNLDNYEIAAQHLAEARRVNENLTAIS
ncbi:KedN5 family methylcobalamin-dependent radical SAM C-methyltransferase [Streptomyces chartreusis]|uniref:KedN5 family methylcobalamin-dependent radical SAM C-methyltransferase n=1 Tax=Streptomyces chartreusis TaxID=1969 RepID=UPI003693CB89